MTPMDDLSEDELVRDWSLAPEDLVFVATCRGPDHRRRFALNWLRVLMGVVGG
jgi:hypothetical protein